MDYLFFAIYWLVAIGILTWLTARAIGKGK